MGIKQGYQLLNHASYEELSAKFLEVILARIDKYSKGEPSKNIKKARDRRQGYATDSKYKDCVENWAMKKAAEHYKSQSFVVTDTSKNKPYDLVVSKKDIEIRVEVKGTATSGEKVFLTKNEVINARENRTDLFILFNIKVDRKSYIASGGEKKHIEGWCPEDKDLLAIQFEYRVPKK